MPTTDVTESDARRKQLAAAHDALDATFLMALRQVSAFQLSVSTALRTVESTVERCGLTWAHLRDLRA